MRVLLALPCGNVIRCRFDIRTPKTSMKYFPYPSRLAYSISVLKKHGHDAHAIDAIAEELSRGEFIERFRKIDPDIVVWETTMASFEDDIELMGVLKEMKPKLLVAAYGYHATPAYEECLLRGYDFVIVGECEYSILGLVRYLSRETTEFPKGVAARGHMPVPRPLIKNLDDELPWPERDSLPMNKYNDPKLSGFNVVLLSSRGCPYRCSFCTVPVYYGKSNYRMRSPEKVVDEMVYIWNKYQDINELYFDDDNFTVSEEHVVGICTEIIRRKLKFNWNCMADANVSDRLLKIMKEAGCTGITIGGESADDNVLKHISKGIRRSDIVRFVDTCKNLKIRTHVTWVLGLPHATKESDIETVKFALDLPSDSLQFMICNPQYGTGMYNWCEKNGYFATTDWKKFTASDACVVDQPGYGHDEVEEVLRLARKLWYRKMLFRRPDILLFHLYNIYRYQGLTGTIRVAAKSLKSLMV